MSEVGESVALVDCLTEKTKTFDQLCSRDVDDAAETIAGQQLIGSCVVYPREIVHPNGR